MHLGGQDSRGSAAEHGGTVSFGSADEPASAMRRAEAAHSEHERRTGVADPGWPE